VHAEDQDILNVTLPRARAGGYRDGRAHAAARPPVAEIASVAQCIALAAATATRLQIAHVSHPDAVALITDAKTRGVSVTAETCPHYLMFTEDALGHWGPYAKCNPPLRTRDAQDRLWEAVGSGQIDVIGTDHSPFLASEKGPRSGDIWGAPPGLPGLEEFLPLMLTAVWQGRLTLPQLVGLICENPARLFGLWPRKGAVSTGADADLTIVDAAATHVHDHTRLHTKARETALLYDGVTFHGRPLVTVVRGRVVMRSGDIVGEPGWGRWVGPH
jgi:allantoinase